ncbi:MAG: hypothetical protein US89_C0004G0017 [Candidatus Peregrinibacteria bacterium GW2011_GWF2_38_29]|nr:MAG: hypothetical protein US89_C0004G0017 [Candidatus Peregrinibacteria bacterium GW2011_GWF2_38_29]HBB02954.1 hypothetical protein [Candidatus Peregrinibacteria bacterium]
MKFDLHNTSNTTKMILIAEFFLVSYLLYALTVNIYQSYQIDFHVKNFENENRMIAEENRKKAEDLLYYTSDAYIDKIAKQNFGLINPGEEVIIIPEGENIPTDDVKDETGKYPLKAYYNLSNSERWWKFFFERTNS